MWTGFIQLNYAQLTTGVNNVFYRYFDGGSYEELSLRIPSALIRWETPQIRVHCFKHDCTLSTREPVVFATCYYLNDQHSGGVICQLLCFISST